jgi:hypothetical protein
VKPEPPPIAALSFTASSRVAFDPSECSSLSDFLSRQPPYSIVELPPGPLAVSLSLSQPVHLFGRETILTPSGDSSIVECATIAVIERVTLNGHCGVAGGGSLRIAGCAVEGGGAVTVSLSASGDAFLDIESCEVRCPSGTAVQGTGAARVRIARAVVADRIVLDDSAAGDIDGSQTAAVMSAGAASVRIVGCDVVGAGVQATSTGAIAIRQCRFTRVPRGVSARGPVGVDVANCTFTQCAMGAVAADDGAGERLRGREGRCPSISRNFFVGRFRGRPFHGRGDKRDRRVRAGAGSRSRTCRRAQCLRTTEGR